MANNKAFIFKSLEVLEAHGKKRFIGFQNHTFVKKSLRFHGKMK